MKRIFWAAILAAMLTSTANRTKAAEAAAEEPAWYDLVEFKGDLRFRYEYIDEDGKDDRHRWRIRARLGLDAQANEDLDLHFRLASGNDDPVSTNQTLDDGFSSKDIRLDHAYLDWHPEMLEGISLWAGKMAMPFVAVSDLIWDTDLSLEGAALKFGTEGEGIELMANAGAFAAEERSSEDDTYLLGAQLAAKLAASETVSVLGGATYYLWDNMEGFPTLYDSTDGFGNDTVEVLDDEGEVEELLYANDYSEIEFFGQLDIKAGLPVKVYGNAVVNDDADDEDTGFLVGTTLGKAKKPGSFQFDYNYRDLEANAVVGAFTDADVFGGGTDGEGHKLQGVYQLSKNWQAAATVILSEIGTSGEGTDYTRAQVDLMAKF